MSVARGEGGELDGDDAAPLEVNGDVEGGAEDVRGPRRRWGEGQTVVLENPSATACEAGCAGDLEVTWREEGQVRERVLAKVGGVRASRGRNSTGSAGVVLDSA